MYNVLTRKRGMASVQYFVFAAAQSLRRRSLSAFVITDTDGRPVAAAAIMGSGFPTPR